MLTEAAPTLSLDLFAVPGVASLVLAEDAPELSSTLSPDAASLVLSEAAPRVTPFFPGAASLVLSPVAPTAPIGRTIIPGVASLVLSEDPPAVTTPTGATVPPASLVFSEDPPAVDHLITLYEVDCIEPSKGQAVLKFSRVDPATLPRDVEVQFVDVVQNYAMIPQNARHLQARVKNGRTESHASTTATMKSSLSIDFLITASEARTLAFDLLYRAWTEAVSMEFIHPSLELEAGDTFQMIGRFGSLIGRIDEAVWTKNRTSAIKATLLAPPGPVMAADDPSNAFGDGAVMNAQVGIGLWGGVPGFLLAHVVLKKKKTATPPTPAVEFLAGSS